MIRIVKNKVYQNNTCFDFEDIFTLEFFKHTDKLSHKYNSRTFYVNEIYNSFILPYLALSYFVGNEKITKIDCIQADPLLKSICIDLGANNSNIEVKGAIYNYDKVIKHISGLFLLLITFAYLIWQMMKIPHKKNFEVSSKFAIARTNAGISKMRNFDIPIEFEDFNKQDSIYRLFPIRKRLIWVWLSFIRSFNELEKIKKITNNYIGKNTSILAQKYYSKRLVHTQLYFQIVDNYFSVNSNSTFYTTNNLDRFSVIEERLSKKYNIKSICIPHGLEYGFKFPKGFSCDIHYTNTLYAETFLNNLYNTTKFVFDIGVAEKMFKLENITRSNQKKVVFFTEPREVYVNQEIIETLIPLLEKKEIKLYLKLHPGDKKSDYTKYNVHFINNLDEALTGNICISRKSTTLLEATYNESVAAAVLINAKDKSIFYTFPSLQSERINVTKSIPELFKWIIQEYEIKNKKL